MRGFIRQLRSDTVKLRRTPFFAAHALIPFAGIAVFLAYLFATGYPADGLSTVYLQSLALAYPVIAAWMCSIVTEQEIESGNGFFMLASPSRIEPLASKLVIVTVSGFASCQIAVLGFAGLAPLVDPVFEPSYAAYAQTAFVIWACSLFLYALHTWLGLRFGRNPSFAVAVVGLLLAALMLTGLGDMVWVLVPSAWGPRLANMPLAAAAGGAFGATESAALGESIAALFTSVLTVCILFWTTRWEGAKNED